MIAQLGCYNNQYLDKLSSFFSICKRPSWIAQKYMIPNSLIETTLRFSSFWIGSRNHAPQTMSQSIPKTWRINKPPQPGSAPLSNLRLPTTRLALMFNQYNVVLYEKYKILGRNIFNKYGFKTRYSMLESLDVKMGEMGLPGKKVFGNKNPSFIEKRKAELEAYLNRVASSGNDEFYKFVRQIKDNEFNLCLTEKFSIQ